MRVPLLLVSCLVIGVTGCAPAALDAESTLRDADRGRAAAAAAKGDVDRVASYWADDAVVIPDDHETIRGIDAVRQYIAESFARPGFAIRWDPQQVRIAGDGTTAWIESHLFISADDESGTNRIESNRSLAVWKRQRDGTWKCAMDIWTGEPPRATPAPTQPPVADAPACADPVAEMLRARAGSLTPAAGDHTPAAVAAAGRAMAMLELAAETEPDCPRTHLQLARLCANFPSAAGLPPTPRTDLVLAAASRAIELDPRLAEAHVLLGLAEMDAWHWNEAEQALRRAVEIAPDDAAAHAALARFLAATGRTTAAIDAIDRARTLAPDDPRVDRAAGEVYHWAGEYGHAVELLRPGAEAGDPEAQFLLGWSHVGERNWSGAASWFERLLPRTDRDAGALLSLAYVYANFGRRRDVPAMLAEAEERNTRMYVPRYRIAAVCVAMGDHRQALRWLERAAVDDRPGLVWLQVDPVMDSLRDEPRFIAVAEQVGFPAAPRRAATGTSGWIPLFNGVDLEGWTPKFAGHPLGENVADTFRVRDGAIEVAYEEDASFDGAFGHLFHEQPFSHYRLRLEYRFMGELCPGAPGWAFRNSGVMIHGQTPATMREDQDFPVSIEVQLLGGDGVSDRPTGNVCTPGTHIVIDDALERRHCVESTSATYHHDDWVTLEIEVRGGELVRHIVYGEVVMEYAQPQLDPNDPDAADRIRRQAGEVLLESGTISLQAEGHPCAFRRIELLPLE